ncbi:MAG: hypothetical protein LBN42_03160 [Oscillospiraceae bacterium]|jgi:hypothetical protein|nr:hypothetical protein [Oscillospiraceae bacterium]
MAKKNNNANHKPAPAAVETPKKEKNDTEQIIDAVFNDKPKAAEPVKAEPVKAEPVKAEPVKAEPVKETKPTPKKETKPAPKKSTTVEDLTAALWNKLSKANISGVKFLRAVQVEVTDGGKEILGSFFIAVRPGWKENDREITFANYDDRTGTLSTTLEEGLKFTKGGYDFQTAIKDGKISYVGDLAGAYELLDLLK